MRKLSDTPNDWISPEHELPPEGEVVNTLNSAGQVTKLKLQGRLWFFADGSMYVYYVPQFWQRIEQPALKDADRGQKE